MLICLEICLVFQIMQPIEELTSIGQQGHSLHVIDRPCVVHHGLLQIEVAGSLYAVLGVVVMVTKIIIAGSVRASVWPVAITCIKKTNVQSSVSWSAPRYVLSVVDLIWARTAKLGGQTSKHW